MAPDIAPQFTKDVGRLSREQMWHSKWTNVCCEKAREIIVSATAGVDAISSLHNKSSGRMTLA